MRRAILLVCLFAFPGVAQAQVAPMYGPTGDPYYRGPVYVRPPYTSYYGYDGGVVPGLPRAAAGRYFSSFGPSGYVNNQPELRGTVPPRRQAGYFYYPNYPELTYPRPDIRPQVYVIPPPPLTPYHDPYFEERIWYDDNYDYWGW